MNPRNPARYQLRGTRCEGVYDPERSGDAALALVSFTSSFESFDSQRERNLFDEVFLTVQPLNANLGPASTLLKDEPYGEGPYPAEVPISLDWKRMKITASGFYSLKIGATVVNGAPATLPLTFYYANP